MKVVINNKIRRDEAERISFIKKERIIKYMFKNVLCSRTEDIKNMMITSWMITMSVAIVLSVALQNITIIKVVSVILGLGFTIIPFKDGLEFILLKKNNEEMFMIEVTSVMLAGSSLVILIIMQKVL